MLCVRERLSRTRKLLCVFRVDAARDRTAYIRRSSVSGQDVPFRRYSISDSAHHRESDRARHIHRIEIRFGLVRSVTTATAVAPHVLQLSVAASNTDGIAWPISALQAWQVNRALQPHFVRISFTKAGRITRGSRDPVVAVLCEIKDLKEFAYVHFYLAIDPLFDLASTHFVV